VPLTVDVPDLLSHWRWFGEWSPGCIGVLGDWLVETVDTLFWEHPLTPQEALPGKHGLSVRHSATP